MVFQPYVYGCRRLDLLTGFWANQPEHLLGMGKPFQYEHLEFEHFYQPACTEFHLLFDFGQPLQLLQREFKLFCQPIRSEFLLLFDCNDALYDSVQSVFLFEQSFFHLMGSVFQFPECVWLRLLLRIEPLHESSSYIRRQLFQYRSSGIIVFQ
jgi:hypothetical protein